MDYVSAVYRDYNIRSRFGHFDPLFYQRSSPHTQTGGERRQEIAIRQEIGVRQERTSSSRPAKQWLNVTQ